MHLQANRSVACSRRCLGAWIGFVLLCGLADGTSAARAADFGVTNKVFVAGSKDAPSVNTTLFHQGLVYDFVESTGEIAIFDPSRDRFTLIHPRKQLSCAVDAGLIIAENDRLKRLAAGDRSPLRRFLVDPKFEERFDASTGLLTLASQQVTYSVQTEAPSERDVVSQYVDFVDWSARLNAVARRGAPLPFARLHVNAALQRRGRLPQDVKLTIQPDASASRRGVQLCSEHEFRDMLSRQDLDRIQTVKPALADCTMVEFPVYQKSIDPKPTANGKAPAER